MSYSLDPDITYFDQAWACTCRSLYDEAWLTRVTTGELGTNQAFKCYVRNDLNYDVYPRIGIDGRTWLWKG